MEKFRKRNLISFLIFLVVNLVVLFLIKFEMISYGPDLQDVFMSFVMIFAIGVASILFFLVKIDEKKGLRLIHYFIYFGYILEIGYLLFES